MTDVMSYTFIAVALRSQTRDCSFCKCILDFLLQARLRRITGFFNICRGLTHPDVESVRKCIALPVLGALYSTKRTYLSHSTVLSTMTVHGAAAVQHKGYVFAGLKEFRLRQVSSEVAWFIDSETRFHGTSPAAPRQVSVKKYHIRMI